MNEEKSKSDKSVCIIILNWNGYDVTKDCLLSLQEVYHRNFKIVLVDNGSSDGSVNKIKDEFSREEVDILSLDRNYGFTGGNNRGIEYAKDKYCPDYYLMLNNDTVVEPSFLTEMIACVEADFNCYAAVPKIYYMEPRDVLWFAGGRVSSITGLGKQFGFRKKDSGKYDFKRKINYMNGCCALLSRHAIEEIGILDDVFFANTEDVDYGLRICDAGKSILYVPTAVIYHKVNYSFNTNQGKWFAFYLVARNKVLLHKKRRKWFATPFFLSVFFVRWVLYMTFKLSILGDFKSVKAIYQGLNDGVVNRLRFVSK